MALHLSAPVTQIFVGGVSNRWPGKPHSAIGKVSVPGLRNVTRTGLQGDEQADLEVHGGPDKAIHHYPADHYLAFLRELADGTKPDPSCFQPGSFGENLTTSGLTEDMVCIGDVFEWGSAILQISQGRQPCWKLALHTQRPQMAYLVQKTLRTGWYYRVLKTGAAAPGDTLRLIERPHPDANVRVLTGARLSRTLPPTEALAFAEIEALNSDWKAAFKEKALGLVEDQTPRLGEA